MPPTVSVAAFIFGIVLLLAALIGKEIRIVTVELPALDGARRILVGVIGVGLMLFGFADGQLPGLNRPSAQSATPTAAIPTGTGAQPPSQVVTDGILPCLADVAAEDLVVLPMDALRRTDRKWSTSQPRAGVMAMQFEDAMGIRGGVKFHSLASAAGIDIIAVFDADCQLLSTYDNVTRPDQPKDAPYNFDTMRYQFSDAIYTADISYGEGDGKLAVRAQQIGQ